MTTWTSGVCNTIGIQQHYTRTGGNLPPLVLLHGLSANGMCWTPVAEHLADQYDVIMPDARGHGQSSKPRTGYHYTTLADDAELLIKALGLSRPTIIGHSMGGMTAALIAVRKKVAINNVILADPPFLSIESQQEVYTGTTLDQHQHFLNQPIEEILKAAKARQPHRSIDTITRVNLARHQTSLYPFEILKPPYPDYQQLISEINCNCLLVIADNGIVSASTASHLQTINPLLQTAIIRDAGHGLIYDKPETFAATTSAFLKGFCSTSPE